MPLLVRELSNTTQDPGSIITLHTSTVSRRHPHYRISEVGNYNIVHDASCTQCHHLGLVIHLETQERESQGEGAARKRISFAYRGLDARQQMYAIT